MKPRIFGIYGLIVQSFDRQRIKSTPLPDVSDQSAAARAVRHNVTQILNKFVTTSRRVEPIYQIATTPWRELKDEKLDVIYEVKNKDNKKMYFSIGAHPAFNCNISEGDKYLEFEKEENLESYIINTENGLIENEKKSELSDLIKKHNDGQISDSQWNKFSNEIISNYKERFPDLKMHLKDLDQNGKNEMVFLVVDDDYSSAIHIYFNLNESKLGQHKGNVIVWTGDSLLFDSADNLYVSSCGSQYCNDTYFKWGNGKLVEEYTDTYESM